MIQIILALTFMLLVATDAKVSSSQPQNPFLKEILLGRCYENPPDSPDGFESICPIVVDSFLNAIAGQFDETIQPDDFFMYMGWTSYDIQKDTALLVWPPSSALTVPSSSEYILPESSSSGALLRGLTFCGPNKHMNCPSDYWNGEDSAMASFWQAVYSDFASKARGMVRMMVLQDDLNSVPSLWSESVLDNLDAEVVIGVEVLATNCDASGIVDLLYSIQNSGVACNCTPIEEIQDRDVPSVCGIGSIVGVDSPAQGSSRGRENANKYNSPGNGSAAIVKCECPENIYMYLFWGLVLFGIAGGYSMWSVWHYLPEYQRVPNVNHEMLERGGENGASLPKQ